jgi:hypothetical protein
MDPLSDERPPLTEFAYYYLIDEGLTYLKGGHYPPVQMPEIASNVLVWVSLPNENEFPSGEHRCVASDADQQFLRVEHVKVVLRFEEGRWTQRDAYDEPESVARIALHGFLNAVRRRTGRYLIDPNGARDSYSVACIDGSGHAKTIPGMITLRVYSDRDQLNPSVWASVAQDCRDGRRTPLYLELLLDARLYSTRDEFRMATLTAGISLEVLVNGILRALLARMTGAAKDLTGPLPPRAERFAKNVTAASAFQLLASLVPTIPEDTVKACIACRETRDQIVHGTLSDVGRDKASAALSAVKALLEVPAVAELVRDMDRS